MEIREGKKVFHGIAIGKVRVFAKTENQVSRRKIEDTQAEVARFEDAKQKAIDQLHALYEKALKEVGEVNAQIFDVHAMMLDDGDYIDSIHNLIEGQNVNAEYAVAQTGDNFAKMFADMDDEYFKARSVDVKDISERVITILNGNDTASDIGEDPVIIVAEDLAPSETVQMDKSKLLGFVTHLGSANSHTAILARTMGIPALISVDIETSWNGKMAILDGYAGKIIVDPDAATLAEYEEKKKKDEEQKELLLTLKGKENVTLSGQKIKLYANIGNIADLAAVLQNDAGGIGLFRSEFIYMENGPKLQTEELQFKEYLLAEEEMGMKKVVIRTADLGGEKTAECLDLGEENNPEMGYRGIRVSLDKDEIFKTQLRAILRASAYGKMSIMFPMVTDVKEVQQAKLLLEKIKKELIGQELSNY